MSLEHLQFCESCLPSYCPPDCGSRKISTGTLFLNCERLKNNGLQDDCTRAKCDKNEGCVQKSPNYRTARGRENEIKSNGLQRDCKRDKCKLKDIYENLNKYSESFCNGRFLDQ